MRGSSAAGPLGPMRCLCCAYRLRATKSPGFLRHAFPRRWIQSSNAFRRPVEAAAPRTDASDEVGEERQLGQQQPSWGFRNSRSPATLGQQRRPHLGSGQNGRDAESRRQLKQEDRVGIHERKANSDVPGESRPLKITRDSQAPTHIRRVQLDSRRASLAPEPNDFAKGFRSFKPSADRQPLNERDRGRAEAQPNEWRHLTRRNTTKVGENHSRSHRDTGTDKASSGSTEAAAPDPWGLRIPSQRGKAPHDDANPWRTGSRRVQNSSGDTASPRTHPAPSFKEERQAYRSERAENSDRYRRIKDRQRVTVAARFGRRSRAEDEDMDADKADRIDSKKLRKAKRRAQKDTAAPTPILLPEFISVGNLANALKVRAEAFTTKLRALGFDDVNVDHIIDAETAGLVAAEFNFQPQLPKEDVSADLVALPQPDDTSLLRNRPPVVTIMGHVDHGKTTLLDWLRKSSVVATEHGGITQHIGAFTVPMPSGRIITFLDTPGHAAFLSMRARGANVTDIVILVVAADDSVKPQTIEAIKHAKDAQVPVIVAINKMDKPDANPQRVKEDLGRHGIEVEDYGGEVQTVEVSGMTGQGMEALEEAVVALADVLDVRAPTDGPVEGWVLESSAKRAGKVATVLVRRGVLTPGSVLVAGNTWARVRALHDANGAPLDSVGPGTPALVDGWREQPDAGDEVLQANSEQRAKQAVEFRQKRQETERMAHDVSARNQARSEELAAEAAAKAAQDAAGEEDTAEAEAAVQKAGQEASGVPELPIVLCADVSGSVEAVDASIQALASPLIRPNILRRRVGPATPSDVRLAELTHGALVAFNISVPGPISLAAERGGVPVVTDNVIYRLVDAVQSAMEARLPDKIGVRVLGEATVLQVFEIGLGGGRGKLPVAGVRIGNGLIRQGGRVRVLRGGTAADPEASDLGGGRRGARRSTDDSSAAANGASAAEQIVFDGMVGTLRSHKKEVPEMRKGSECGLSFEGGFAGFAVGDRVQYYEETRERLRLNGAESDAGAA